jgi:hypothetical protein
MMMPTAPALRPGHDVKVCRCDIHRFH